MGGTGKVWSDMAAATAGLGKGRAGGTLSRAALLQEILASRKKGPDAGHAVEMTCTAAGLEQRARILTACRADVVTTQWLGVGKTAARWPPWPSSRSHHTLLSALADPGWGKRGPGCPRHAPPGPRTSAQAVCPAQMAARGCRSNPSASTASTGSKGSKESTRERQLVLRPLTNICFRHTCH